MTRLISGFLAGLALGFYLFREVPIPVVCPVCPPRPAAMDCAGPIQGVREACKVVINQSKDSLRESRESESSCKSDLARVQEDVSYWQRRLDDCIRGMVD